MLGYYYLAFVLALAFVGIGFYLLGPKLKHWDEKLNRQLSELEAKRGKDGQGPDEQLASPAGGSSSMVGPQDIGVGASSTSLQAGLAVQGVVKRGGAVHLAPGLATFSPGLRVYVRTGANGRGVVVMPKLRSAAGERRLSSRARRGGTSIAAMGPGRWR